VGFNDLHLGSQVVLSSLLKEKGGSLSG